MGKRKLEADSRPLVLEINGVVIETPIISDKTTIVLNDEGRLLLKKLLGGMSRNDYEARSITGKDAEWLDFLYSIL